MGNGLPAAVGEAVIGTVLIILGAFAPLILFRLLAFVDPGTSSGQAFRASLDAAGGLPGLLGGKGGGSDARGTVGGGSGAATATSGDGTSSQGEAAAGAATQSRLATAIGPAGAAASGLSKAGQAASAFGADTLSAAGVGHQSPYFGSPASNPTRNTDPASRRATRPAQPARHAPQDGSSHRGPGPRWRPGDTPGLPPAPIRHPASGEPYGGCAPPARPRPRTHARPANPAATRPDGGAVTAGRVAALAAVPVRPVAPVPVPGLRGPGRPPCDLLLRRTGDTGTQQVMNATSATGLRPSDLQEMR